MAANLPRVTGTDWAKKIRKHLASITSEIISHLTKTLHVPIFPMSVKAPVVASMLYIETLFEPEFVT